MCHCEVDCTCDLACNFVKDFEGVYRGSGKVYYVNLENGEVYLIEDQEILLEIKKIANSIYYAKFIEFAPNAGLTFSCIATQTTENKYLIQSGTSGLNSFYFDITQGFDVLNASFTTPNINGESFSATIKYIRQ